MNLPEENRFDDRFELDQCIDEIKRLKAESSALAAKLKEATDRAATWERLHDHRTAELDAKDMQIATLTKERDDAVAAMRTVLTSLKDEFKAANEERLKETQDAHTEANRWKAEGDMYGWNFHEGRAGGTTYASIYFYRVYRKLVAALSDAPAAQPSEAERLSNENLKLRKIASFVPAKVYITASERAGYGNQIKAD
jgi:hypothetical protein